LTVAPTQNSKLPKDAKESQGLRFSLQVSFWAFS